MDLDGGTTDSVVEYNYPHGNAGSGLLNAVPNAPENALSIYGNTFFTNKDQSTNKKAGSSACFLFGYSTGTWAAGSQIKDNICYLTNKGSSGKTGQLYYNPNTQTGMTLANNLYFGTNTAALRVRAAMCAGVRIVFDTDSTTVAGCAATPVAPDLSAVDLAIDNHPEL